MKYEIKLSSLGGKLRLLSVILPIILFRLEQDSLKGLIDTHGGGNSFLPNIFKNRAIPFRVYNEIDNGIASMFEVLKDPQLSSEFVEKTLKLQSYIVDKYTFESAKMTKLSSDTDKVTAAALALLVSKFSYAGDRESFVKSAAKKGLTRKYVETFKTLTSSMETVHVTSVDAHLLIQAYKNRKDILFLIDPPYTTGKGYTHRYPITKHIELLKILTDAKAAVILFGTPNDLYDNWKPEGWYRYYLKTIHKSSSGKPGTFQHEIIWTNRYVPPHYLPDQVY